MEGSIETILNGLKNPKGPGSIPIQSRGAKPRGIGLEFDLGPRDFLIHSILFRWIHIPIRCKENFAHFTHACKSRDTCSHDATIIITKIWHFSIFLCILCTINICEMDTASTIYIASRSRCRRWTFHDYSEFWPVSRFAVSSW